MITRILDTYIKRPVMWDVIIVSFIAGVYKYLCKVENYCTPININSLDTLLNELVSSSLAVGGFIIASLTIIVTIKDNLRSKSADEKTNIELIFNSKHYSRIVRVFFWASIVLLILFLYFSILAIVRNTISTENLMLAVLSGLIISVLSVARCLLILNNIIHLQIKNIK